MDENAGDDNVFTSSNAADGHGVQVSGSNVDHLFLPPSKAFNVKSIEADPSRRSQHFRKLISDVAEHLDKNDVDKIVWQKELPQKMKDKPALSVLEYLYKNGEFSMDELRPLTQLLKEIHREDMTGKVELFQEKFGRHASLPLNSPKPHLPAEKKANTLSGGQTFTQVADTSLEKSPLQESVHDDSNASPVNSTRSSRPRNSSSTRSVSTVPSENADIQHLFPEQPPMSHDQSHSPSSLLLRLPDQLESSQKRKMPKQMSCELIEAVHHVAPMTDVRRMHRSSSSNTATSGVRSLESHSLASSLHGDLLHNPIMGQRAWRFNSNPSSGNVSQENILGSSHSDVGTPMSTQRVFVRPHHHPPPYHQRAFSHSHTFSQDQPAAPYHSHSASASGSYHAVNHQISPVFPAGDFSEALPPHANHNYHPSQHGHCGGQSLSQSSCHHYSTVQPCACQQQHIASGFQSQEQLHVAAIVHGHQHHHHQKQHSGGSGAFGAVCVNCSGSDSRCVSQAGMRPQMQAVAITQPPQTFPTAYPSMQNVSQQPFSPSFATPHQTTRHPPPARHLSLITPHDHQQGQVAHRYSGYGTDGSGDDVFHSYSEDHQFTVPERSSTHPQVSNGTSKMANFRMWVPQDSVSSQTETLGSRRTPGHSGVRGSEISMEIPYIGPAAVPEKTSSKHTWDVPSHSGGELNDSDSGFIGSSPHGETSRRSFTPNTTARIHNELKKLQQQSPPPPVMLTNAKGSSKGSMTESPAKQFRQSKKKTPSVSCEPDDGHEDSLSDDNIPVVYKDDDNDAKWSSVARPSKDKERSRAIARGAVQYRSLRYERDKQPHRRKPNRSSLQSFDGNTPDSCRPKHVAPKSPGTGSSHSLKSKSSQDNLTNLKTGVPPQVRDIQQNNQHSQCDNESTTVNGKHSKMGLNAKSSGRSTTTQFNPLHSTAHSGAPPDQTDSTASFPQSAQGTITVSQPTKRSWLASKLHFRTKPQAKLLKPNKLMWPIKREKLNKYIYESKYTKKALQCKHKLELESRIGNGNGTQCLKLRLEMHPYGLEEDQNENMTITVHVERPKHCHLHSSTVIAITLNIREYDSGEEIGESCTKHESIRSSYFLIKEFVSHEAIKKSGCNFLELNVQASLVASDGNKI